MRMTYQHAKDRCRCKSRLDTHLLIVCVKRVWQFVLTSSELPELLGHRQIGLSVMNEGKVTPGEFSHDEATEKKLMAAGNSRMSFHLHANSF